MRLLANTLLVAIALFSVEGCRDAPTALEELRVQAVEPPSPGLSRAALTSFRELLDDELVRELAYLADEEHPARRVSSALRALREHAAGDNAPTIFDALAHAERTLGDEEDPSDDVVLSALALMLESARDVLEGKSETEQEKASYDDDLQGNRPTRRTR